MGVPAYRRLIRGDSKGPIASIVRSTLGIASLGYALGARAKNALYDQGWKTAHRAEVPVVSVGNLTVGGTGKTPMVEFIARRFLARGHKVAILSRGYRATEGLNDEGRVLQSNLPEAVLLQNPDRVASAEIAVRDHGAEVLVLDDGFQHRRLARDLDVVMLDALEPFGFGHLLPRGLLREPIASLKRAGLVLLSRADLIDDERKAEIRKTAERAAGPLVWAEARHAPRDLIDDHGRSEPLDALRQGPIVAFCGLGNPEGFRRTLEGLGATVIGFRSFPDHHAYSASDLDALMRWAEAEGASMALTTQKDWVKLRDLKPGPVPLRALRIGLELTAGASNIEEALDRLEAGYR